MDRVGSGTVDIGKSGDTGMFKNTHELEARSRFGGASNLYIDLDNTGTVAVAVDLGDGNYEPASVLSLSLRGAITQLSDDGMGTTTLTGGTWHVGHPNGRLLMPGRTIEVIGAGANVIADEVQFPPIAMVEKVKGGRWGRRWVVVIRCWGRSRRAGTCGAGLGRVAIMARWNGSMRRRPGRAIRMRRAVWGAWEIGWMLKETLVVGWGRRAILIRGWTWVGAGV